MVRTDILDLPGEREPLPYFAGRKAELAQLEAKLRRVASADGARAGITLITGIPGSGKSALGLQFTNRVRNKDGVTCCEVDPSALRSQFDLFDAMASALGKEQMALELTGRESKVKSVSGGRAGVKGTVSHDHARNAPQTLGRLLQLSASSGMWDGSTALVLLIDELQTLRLDDDDNLVTLHKGTHGCPIFVIGMGLHYTPRVLNRHGVSRIEPPITLGRLAHAEAVEAIAGNLRAVNCGEVADECLQALADASYGFPQHIQAYLATAVQVVRERGELAVGDALQEVLTAGDARRINYYQARLRAMDVRSAHDAMFPIVRAMYEAGIDALQEIEAVKLCDAAEYDGERVVDEAVARGVLMVNADGTVGFGIPSFKQYMIDRWLASRDRG